MCFIYELVKFLCWSLFCVFVFFSVLKGARAFQFSSLVEVISTEKCRLCEARATPVSLFLGLCRKLCIWLWRLIKVHGWWWGKRRGKKRPVRGKSAKIRSECLLDLCLSGPQLFRMNACLQNIRVLVVLCSERWRFQQVARSIALTFWVKKK